MSYIYYIRHLLTFAQTLQESAVGVQARHLGRPLPANPRRPGGAAGRRAQAKSTCLWIDAVRRGRDPRRIGRWPSAHQAFGLHRLDHRRAAHHAAGVSADVRPGRQVELGVLAPAEHGGEVAVGHREGVTEQILLAGQLLVEVAKALADHLDGCFLGVVAGRRVEQRTEVLVQLGGDEIQHLHQAVALERAGGRGQSAARLLVGDVLQHHADLGQHLAVVELQRRHVAFGIDGGEVGARFGFLGHQVDLFQVEFQAGFAQGDVRGHGTGAGGVIQLHGTLLALECANEENTEKTHPWDFSARRSAGRGDRKSNRMSTSIAHVWGVKYSTRL